jgi:large subunit ribosomal protein L1
MGAKRKTTEIKSEEAKIVQPVNDQPQGDVQASDAAEDLTTEKKKVAKKSRVRSARYVAVRAQIDKTKKYDLFAGVELLKKLSYTKFAGTVTAHAEVKEAGMTASLTLPHSTGKSVRVAIVDDAVLKDIAEGKINFDVLVSAPQFMPKLAKFAPVLGPKGLMPNPKNGTLTPNPEAQKKKLEAGTVSIKTEKKAPLMHVRVGKTDMTTKELVANIEALIKSLGIKLVNVNIAATMSPGIKIDPGTVLSKE